MSGFIVGGEKSDFRESWRRQNRLFPSYYPLSSATLCALRWATSGWAAAASCWLLAAINISCISESVVHSLFH